MKTKSSRNKTISLSDAEKDYFGENLLLPSCRLTEAQVFDQTILGDALEVIDFLPESFVDLLFVDPPYNINKVFGTSSFKKMGTNAYERWVRYWFSKIITKLKPTASIYVCGDWRSSSALYRVLSDYVQIRNRITWEREKGRGAKNNWKNVSEDIWFATVGEDYYFDVESVKLKKNVIAPYRDEAGNPKDWSAEKKGNFRLTHPSNLWKDLTVPFWSMPENTGHPTQKPEKLLARVILASSREGECILDPFLGSGTTSVVAKKLRRRYVGIEIDKYYACVAEKRLAIAEANKRIQGYEGGVFRERNTRSDKDAFLDNVHQRSSAKDASMNKEVHSLIQFIRSHDGVGDKTALTKKVQEEFKLVKDRSVYYSPRYAIRFSSTRSVSFSNTVIALSTLQKYDELPFLVCQVTPSKNFLYLANTTFLRKVSHSSQQLRVDNIKGSVNGSDITKVFNGIANEPENFEELFNIHCALGFSENLPRLVEATNDIVPSGSKFKVSSASLGKILEAPERATKFVQSPEFLELRSDLDVRVRKVTDALLVTGLIENVNIRGRVIEYMIAGDDEERRKQLIYAIILGNGEIPKFRTTNDLGDYTRIFDQYETATDVKTKIMVLNSNPKAYNIDKLLEYLGKDKLVFMFYFIGIKPNIIVNQVLVSSFQADLLKSTIILKHWAGRNSRGVSQFKGSALNKLILSPDNRIDKQAS